MQDLQMSSATVLSREPNSPVEAILIFTAVSALLLGSAVYFLNRDRADTMLLQPFITCQWQKSTVFGTLGGHYDRQCPECLCHGCAGHRSGV